MTYSGNDLDRIMNHFGNPKQEEFTGQEDILDKHFLLEDVIVKDSMNVIREVYSSLYIPKELCVKATVNDDEIDDMHTYPIAQSNLAQEGKFIPSSPLLSKVVERMFFDAIKYEGGFEIKDLEKYQWLGSLLNTNTQVMTNTCIEHENSTIHHYPQKELIMKHDDIIFEEDDLFNEKNVPYTRKIMGGIGGDIALKGGNYSDKEFTFMESILGYDNLAVFIRMGQHLGVHYEINTSGLRSDLSNVLMGESVFTGSAMKDMQLYTYCIDPSWGDNK